jgi:hypothetical protein
MGVVGDAVDKGEIFCNFIGEAAEESAGEAAEESAGEAAGEGFNTILPSLLRIGDATDVGVADNEYTDDTGAPCIDDFILGVDDFLSADAKEDGKLVVDFDDTGTKGDEDNFILPTFDVDEDIPGVDVDVDTRTGPGVGVLFDAKDFEESILLNGYTRGVALLITDGGPDTSDIEEILKFCTGVGVFATSGDGDGAGVISESLIGDSGLYVGATSSNGGGADTIDSTSLDVLSFNDSLGFELKLAI